MNHEIRWNQEDLITEARLAPGLARRMEDAVLQQTTQHGQWK